MKLLKGIRSFAANTKLYRLCLLMVGVMMTIACQESLEDRCEREAKEYTKKHCPIPMDKGIVMDSMTFDKTSHTICYAYTLRGELDDSAVVNGSNSKGLLQQQVKNSANLKLYKEAGYNFRYVYHSGKEKGKRLLDVIFSKKDYE